MLLHALVCVSVTLVVSFVVTELWLYQEGVKWLRLPYVNGPRRFT